MSKIARGLVAAGFTVALGTALATPAYADPMVELACDDDDHHVTVEVLNTEVASVCYE